MDPLSYSSFVTKLSVLFNSVSVFLRFRRENTTNKINRQISLSESKTCFDKNYQYRTITTFFQELANFIHNLSMTQNENYWLVIKMNSLFCVTLHKRVKNAPLTFFFIKYHLFIQDLSNKKFDDSNLNKMISNFKTLMNIYLPEDNQSIYDLAIN